MHSKLKDRLHLQSMVLAVGHVFSRVDLEGALKRLAFVAFPVVLQNSVEIVFPFLLPRGGCRKLTLSVELG